MFQNDVTKNYQLQDATLEILIMLAGAFLLGALFSWLLSKLRGDKNPQRTSHHEVVDHRTHLNPVDTSSQTRANNTLLKGATGAAVGTAGVVGSSIATAGSSIKDLAGNASDKVTDTGSSILDSATDTAQTAGNKLASAGSSIADSVSDTVSAAGDKVSSAGSSVTDSISNTVSSAGNKLTEVGTNVSDAVSETVSDGVTATTDNFKKIEGIGPKIETTLYAAGINTYADLRASDTATLRTILDTAGPAFKMHDPETWPYQADLAYNEKWEKLKEYQDFLMGSED
ncbi:MAG TPA: hypothetical protein EYG68_09660 [Leucothrix mucor]|nr:hypothetical protein [Leucothrix mucor]